MKKTFHPLVEGFLFFEELVQGLPVFEMEWAFTAKQDGTAESRGFSFLTKERKAFFVISFGAAMTDISSNIWCRAV